MRIKGSESMDQTVIRIRDACGHSHTYTENTLNSSYTKQYLLYPELCVTQITEGEGIWQIGSEACQIKAGDLVFLSNLEPRRLLDGIIGIRTFSCDAASLGQAGAADCLRVFYGRSPTFSHVLTAPELLSFCDRYREEVLQDEGQVSFCLLTAYTVELLIGAQRAYDRQQPGALTENFSCDRNTASAIAFSAAYINEHLTEPLRVPDLAARVGMSTGHYTRMFRKYISLTPADYIARCRMQRFLSGTEEDGNVLDRALACGFSSSSGFYKTCHRLGIVGKP